MSMKYVWNRIAEIRELIKCRADVKIGDSRSYKRLRKDIEELSEC